jgi:tRNA U34 5-carboxymethylaminomethyl modifying GTPase MnmE/TrmE
MEICFSFDTTGSMSSCIAQVKGRVQDLIQRLQADIPGIRMAVVAHGDYCDTHTYIKTQKKNKKTEKIKKK